MRAQAGARQARCIAAASRASVAATGAVGPVAWRDTGIFHVVVRTYDYELTSQAGLWSQAGQPVSRQAACQVVSGLSLLIYC